MASEETKKREEDRMAICTSSHKQCEWANGYFPSSGLVQGLKLDISRLAAAKAHLEPRSRACDHGDAKVQRKEGLAPGRVGEADGVLHRLARHRGHRQGRQPALHDGA